jgi:hypothetical protein
MERVEQLTVVSRTTGMSTMAREGQKRRSLLPHRPRRSRSIRSPFLPELTSSVFGNRSAEPRRWNFATSKLR